MALLLEVPHMNFSTWSGESCQGGLYIQTVLLLRDEEVEEMEILAADDQGTTRGVGRRALDAADHTMQHLQKQTRFPGGHSSFWFRKKVEKKMIKYLEANIKQYKSGNKIKGIQIDSSNRCRSLL